MCRLMWISLGDLVGVGTINDGATPTAADTVYAHISVNAASVAEVL